MKITREKSEYGKLWRMQNPDKVRANNKRRTAEQNRKATANYYTRNSAAIKQKLHTKYASMTIEQKADLARKHRQWRLANPEKVKACAAKYRAKPGTKEKERMAAKKFALAHPGYSNAARQKSIRKRQIALAGRPKPKRCETCLRASQKLCWDHCHKTGKFRGWICKSCNTALGCVRDSAKTLRRLADLLDAAKLTHKASQTHKHTS